MTVVSCWSVSTVPISCFNATYTIYSIESRLLISAILLYILPYTAYVTSFAVTFPAYFTVDS